MSNKQWLVPDWPAPPRVNSLITTRVGGVSAAPYASLNLGDHVGDDPLAVTANRRHLASHLPSEPCWLNQVHGTTVIEAMTGRKAAPVADASFARLPVVVCAVLTADCLPVLFCDRSASVVAAAHAGWRGLLAGVLEQTVIAMDTSPEHLLAYFGPAIGPRAFEVGDEVRRAFVASRQEAATAFRPAATGKTEKWFADIYLLARQRLRQLGITAIYGGQCCTWQEKERFFSYRRDGATGRMASLIWLSTN